MKDDNIKQLTENLKIAVAEVNDIMKKLHLLNVEVRIAYKDNTNGATDGIPYLDLWRVIEHNNYLKDE